MLLAVALGWIALITTATTQYGEMVIPFVLAGIGMGLTFAPAASVVMASASDADRGVASGTNNTIREVGVAMGVAVLASVFASAGSYESPARYADGLVPAVWTGAAIVAVGAVVALLLPGRKRTAYSVGVLDADDVRRIALSFPETVEKQRWGHPTFDVAGRMFITVPDDQTSFAVRCPAAGAGRADRGGTREVLGSAARGGFELGSSPPRRARGRRRTARHPARLLAAGRSAGADLSAHVGR